MNVKIPKGNSTFLLSRGYILVFLSAWSGNLLGMGLFYHLAKGVDERDDFLVGEQV